MAEIYGLWIEVVLTPYWDDPPSRQHHQNRSNFFYNFKSLIVFDESRQFLAHSNVGKDDSEGS